MVRSLTLVGYGEAWRTFARAAGWEHQARVFDVKTNAPQTRAAMLANYDADGVMACENAGDALNGSGAILGLVTADQALLAAEMAAQHIASGVLFFDMNSVAPDTKREAAKLIEAAGGRYVDVAVMAPVDPARMAGVVDEVLGSLGEGWREKADYNLERMKTHGIRRAAETEEVAKTLSALGIEPLMTNGAIVRLREMAA